MTRSLGMRPLLAAIAVAVFAAAGCQERSHHAPSADAPPAQTPANAAAPYDLQFLDTMTKHHQDAVDMARIAEEKIQHAGLKELAAKIPPDQEKEIAQMKAWRDAWYPGQPPAANMTMPGMESSHMDMTHMQSMAPGKEFDVMFIDMMIAHHEGALTMARDALAKAEHPELKELASRIIEAQTTEIEEMRRWKSELGSTA